MSKIHELEIRRFNLGITTDVRSKDFRYAQLISNFDAQTFETKLVPYPDTESGDSDANNTRLQNFALGYDGTNWNLYGLGQISSSNSRARVVYRALTDLADATWTAGAQQTAAGAVSPYLFVYYHKTGKIYLASGTQYLKSFVANGATWGSDTEADLTSFTNVAQGLVHSKDDILYVPYDNKIAKNNNGSWTVAALTLPTHFKITSICEYGNFLAIAVTPLSGVGNSRVYLWDRDSSLTTISESIDWGDGQLHVIEEVDGYLIGVSYVGGSNILLNNVKVVFRAYSGGQPQVFRELVSDNKTLSSALNDLPLFKQKVNKNLFFQMSITLGGNRVDGIWRVGRTSSNEPLSAVLDQIVNNGVSLGTSPVLSGFFILGDYRFQSWNNTSGYNLDKTDDQIPYTANATYETLKIGDPKKKFKLISAGVETEALTSAGTGGSQKASSVTLKYKTEAETAWTTIFSNSSVLAGSFVAGTTYTITSVGSTDFTAIGASSNTTGVVFTATGVGSGTGVAAAYPLFHESVNIESTDANLPQFREIQFQILSTGKAVITGLWCKYEEVDSDLTQKI